MSDILTRLKALGVTKGMPEKPAAPVRKSSDNMTALLKEFPNGIVTENDHGYCFINRLTQPLSQLHGSVRMDAQLCPSPLFDSMMETGILRKEDTLAFDTETSGLSNGSGSFIFMLGLGYFDGDNYTVDQLILPDLGDEPAFLRQTELIFSRFPILISYNGRGFDIPMLQGRLNFHMFPDFTKEITHIDLLNLTRRYWKASLGSVRLANIEQYVLKLQRGDEEVPGYMAPELYREFLRSGDAAHISGIAYHNQIDVVSLSAFLLYLNDLCIRGEKDPSVWETEGVQESGLLRHNLTVFSGQVISKIESFSIKEKKQIAAKFLKAGDREKALPILEELADGGDYDSADRLMKLYFREKDPERFEKFRARAIFILENDETVGKWTREEKIGKLRELKIKVQSSKRKDQS